jgi:hypothetical protein
MHDSHNSSIHIIYVYIYMFTFVRIFLIIFLDVVSSQPILTPSPPLAWYKWFFNIKFHL